MFGIQRHESQDAKRIYQCQCNQVVVIGQESREESHVADDDDAKDAQSDR